MQMEERYNYEHSSVDESVVVQMDSLEQSSAPWIGRTIKTVWEPGKIVRSHDSTGKEIWTCGHCNMVFKHHNHTKALSHCLDGPNIQRCKKMPVEWRNIYSTIRGEKTQKKVQKECAAAGIIAEIEERERVAMDFLGVARTAEQTAYQESPLKPHSVQESLSSISTKRGGGDVSMHLFGSESASAKKKKNYHQLTLVTNASNNLKQAAFELNTAIAHFLVANSLPFSLAEDPLLKRMLVLSRNVNSTYEPPSRYEISGKYLTLIHDSYCREGIERLVGGGPSFGISIFGDGATIRRIPLINMLGSNPDAPSVMLDVVDCSQHMSNGGKKDAWYIAKKFLPVMKEIDPDKQYIDLVVFDGASNIQKAAQLLEEHYPKVTVQTGIEHTVSLIFGRLYRAAPIFALCKFAKTVSLLVLFTLFDALLIISVLFTTVKKCIWCTAPCSSLPFFQSFKDA
jgi:hypothetical protein